MQLPDMQLAIGLGMEFAGIILLAFLVKVGLVLLGRFKARANRALERAYAGLNAHPAAEPGDVVITYDTYHGIVFLAYVTTHQVALPPDDARQLLARLMRFNLAWGWFALFGPLVPPLAVWNYFAQRRAIARQQVSIALSADPQSRAPSAPSAEPNANPYASPQSLVNDSSASRADAELTIGSIAARLGAVFATCTVLSLVIEPLEGATFGFVIMAVLGLAAWRRFCQRESTTQYTILPPIGRRPV